PADARPLHSAERRAQIAQHPAVDPDDADLQLGGDAMRTRQIASPERSGKTVACGVGELERFLRGLEGKQRRHRTEDLLLIGAAAGAEALDQRGLHEEPARASTGDRRPAAAAENAAAF